MDEIELTQDEIDYLRETMDNILEWSRYADGTYGSFDADEVGMLQGLVKKLV